MRIGIVEYSNAAPLTEALPRELVRPGKPAQVADWLVTGDVDVALLPAIELGRMPGVTALPRWGVGADGHCESVLLFSKCPLIDVKRVVLDGASRTSAALTRILLEREAAEGVEYLKREGGSVAERLEGADATLLIGDPALAATVPAGVTVFDLAKEWKRHVGLPFVFALWVARPGFELGGDDLALLDGAAERGLADLPGVAERESRRTGVPPERMLPYLQGLQHRLGEAHLRGLRAFLDEAFRIGILPERPDVRFVT